jgi:hypothetical protein
LLRRNSPEVKLLARCDLVGRDKFVVDEMLIAPGPFFPLLTKLFALTDAIWLAARLTAAADAF